MGFCEGEFPDGEWKDIYGDPVRPRRNGYELPPDALQVGAWTAIAVMAILHYTVQVPFLEGGLFIAVFVVSTVLVGCVVVLKIYLELFHQEDPVVFDPTLPRLSQEELNDDLSPPGKEACVFCRRFVANTCKHCSVCDKCVPGFDHHCRWLNSCVGEKNYRYFALFMVLAWVGMAWVAAFSLYTIVEALRDIDGFKLYMKENAYHSSSSAFPVIVVFNFLCLALTVAGICALGKLISFHMYLHYTGQSTYEHILKKRERKKLRGEYKSRGETPPDDKCACLGLHKRRDFKKHGNAAAAAPAANTNEAPAPGGSTAFASGGTGDNRGAVQPQHASEMEKHAPNDIDDEGYSAEYSARVPASQRQGRAVGSPSGHHRRGTRHSEDEEVFDQRQPIVVDVNMQ